MYAYLGYHVVGFHPLHVLDSCFFRELDYLRELPCYSPGNVFGVFPYGFSEFFVTEFVYEVVGGCRPFQGPVFLGEPAQDVKPYQVIRVIGICGFGMKYVLEFLLSWYFQENVVVIPENGILGC